MGFDCITIVLLQDLEGEREVNKEEVLEYCNSSDVNVPLIETSAKVCYPTYNTYIARILGNKPCK